MTQPLAVIMAGGTGGHIFPALAVAAGLQAEGWRVVWLGTRQGLESRLVPPSGIEIEWLAVRGVRGKGLAGLLTGVARLALAVVQAVRVLRRRKPDLMVGFGGFAALPGGLAAALLRRPLHSFRLTSSSPRPTGGPTERDDRSKISIHQTWLRRVQTQHPSLRGPFLAEIHLLLASPPPHSLSDYRTPSPSRLLDIFYSSEGGIVSEWERDLGNLLAEYIWRFRCKQCCFSDVKPVLQSLPSASLSAVHLWAEALLTTLQQELLALCSSSDSNSNSNSTSTSTRGEGCDVAPKKSCSSGKKKKKKSSLMKLSVVQENCDVLLAACSYCKIDQVAAFCQTLLGLGLGGSSSEEVSRNRWSVYGAVRRVFKQGVGGEVRNVQPGDELLLENSSRYRQNCHHLRYNNNNSNNTTVATFLTAMEWTGSLCRGVEASQHAYGLKLDLIDPLRLLCVPQAALVSFNAMGTKHIQLDTLSYLIVPVLMEGGWIAEAAKHYRAILHFHTTAKRETLDMMGHSFDLGNYLKAIELKGFVDRCKASIQLAVSRAELPLLELADRDFSIQETIDYLQVMAYLITSTINITYHNYYCYYYNYYYYSS